jgi:DNA-directed RNA polymerase alpha subunit
LIEVHPAAHDRVIMTLESSINELELDVRPFNLLFRNGCRTVKDVCAYTEWQLLQIEGLGLVSLNNIKDALAKAGFSLPR